MVSLPLIDRQPQHLYFFLCIIKNPKRALKKQIFISFFLTCHLEINSFTQHKEKKMDLLISL